MEPRQFRYFVCVVELGSMSRAALELGVVPSALSQQISRPEGELATRLLQRSSKGVTPTGAGLAFFREAQLTLRHAAKPAAPRSRRGFRAASAWAWRRPWPPCSGLPLMQHLGVVMALFLTLPQGKFAQAVYRCAALLKFAIEKRLPNKLALGAD